VLCCLSPGGHRGENGKGDWQMEGLVAIIVQAIAGALGGGLVGNIVKTAGMALLPS
jgi:hypothetical protein